MENKKFYFKMTEDEDPLLYEAIKIAEQNEYISASRLQANLTIGYPKAMKLIEQLISQNILIKLDVGKYCLNKNNPFVKNKNYFLNNFIGDSVIDESFEFTIPKIDNIINKKNNVFILFKDNSTTSGEGYAVRCIEHRMIHNLLQKNIPCAIFHMLYGNEFNCLERTHKDYKLDKDGLVDIAVDNEIAKYPLYEFKLFGNDRMEICTLIENFLINKVKYIFVNEIWLEESENNKLISVLYDLAEKYDLKIVIRSHSPYYEYITNKSLLKKIVNSSVVTTKTADDEFYVTVVDSAGNFLSSEPIKMKNKETYDIE